MLNHPQHHLQVEAFFSQNPPLSSPTFIETHLAWSSLHPQNHSFFCQHCHDATTIFLCNVLRLHLLQPICKMQTHLIRSASKQMTYQSVIHFCESDLLYIDHHIHFSNSDQLCINNHIHISVISICFTYPHQQISFTSITHHSHPSHHLYNSIFQARNTKKLGRRMFFISRD